MLCWVKSPDKNTHLNKRSPLISQHWLKKHSGCLEVGHWLGRLWELSELTVCAVSGWGIFIRHRSICQQNPSNEEAKICVLYVNFIINELICVCDVCLWAQAHKHMQQCVWRSEDNLVVSPHLLPCLRQISLVHCCISTTSFWCLISLPPISRIGLHITDTMLLHLAFT